MSWTGRSETLARALGAKEASVSWDSGPQHLVATITMPDGSTVTATAPDSLTLRNLLAKKIQHLRDTLAAVAAKEKV